MAVKYGMLIDLGKCVGCGTCAIACKTENNTRHEDLVNGRKYNWADYHVAVKGTFPDTKFEVTPVLCNHCGERTVNDPPCIMECPVAPDSNGNKAIWKTSTGITMRDDARCKAGIIAGCARVCMDGCPYSSHDVNAAPGVQWSVNHFNPDGTSSHPYWENGTAVITGGTSTPAGLATAAGTAPPCKNDYSHPNYNAVRPANTVEKCYFCEHRLLNGEEPYCVVSCPTGARVFGDQNDSSSQIAQIKAANSELCLQNNLDPNGVLGWQLPGTGVSPNVFYIGPFLPNLVGTEEAIAQENNKLSVYPNPATDNAMVEFELATSTEVVISLFDIQGRRVEKFTEKHFDAGTQSFKIDVSKISNGTYICSLKTKEGVLMRSNIVIAR